MTTRLPIISQIAVDYIWLPISKFSFSLYNTLLGSDRQNLSKESLKQLNMMHFKFKQHYLMSRETYQVGRLDISNNYAFLHQYHSHQGKIMRQSVSFHFR